MSSENMPPDTRIAHKRNVKETVDVGMQTGRSFVTECTVEVATQTISKIVHIRRGIKFKRHKELSCLARSHSVCHDATIVCKAMQNDHCYLNDTESHQI